MPMKDTLPPADLQLARRLERTEAMANEMGAAWKDIASLSGVAGLHLIGGLHDEALSGKWAGYRSSRLGLQWRVIYRVVISEGVIQVASVTPHDYRRS